MRKFLALLASLLLIASVSLADSSLSSAYQQAVREAGTTTASLVDSIDLSEFQDHYGISLTEDEELLVRIALMAYSNGAFMQHPKENALAIANGSQTEQYIGNKNSHKFHYSWCSSVSDIKEKNKVIFSSREEAVSQDYVPCKKCNP